MKSSFKKLMSFLLVTVLMIGCLAIAPVASAASYNIAFSTESKTVNKGDSFTINVNIDSNPGITMLRLYVEYDPSILTLTGAKDNGIMGDYTFDNTYASPFCMVWANGTSNNITATGAVATLTFTASGDITTQTVATEIKVYTESKNDILNYDLDTINPTFTNGTVTVYPEGVPTTLAIKRRALTLYNDLTINFGMLKTVMTESGYTDPYIEFNFNGEDTVCETYYGNGNYYMFDFNNIAPDMMNETITATLCATYNGKLVKAIPMEYSIATYCYNMLDRYVSDSNYAEFCTLLVDLLNYGAAAQNYTDRNLDSLANKDLTVVHRLFATAECPATTSVTNKDYATITNPMYDWNQVGLHLTDSVLVRLRFKSLDANVTSASGLTVKFNCVNGTYSVKSFEKTDNGWYVYFDGLNAGQMKEDVFATVYSGDTAVSDTIRYSIESYVHSHKADGDELGTLVQEMYKYGCAAKAYADKFGL